MMGMLAETGNPRGAEEEGAVSEFDNPDQEEEEVEGEAVRALESILTEN